MTVTFQQFLEKMRDSRAADLVALITVGQLGTISLLLFFQLINLCMLLYALQNFIQEVSRQPINPERDAQLVQEFLAKAESRLRNHPLWDGASDEELEASGEGEQSFLKDFNSLLLSPQSVNPFVGPRGEKGVALLCLSGAGLEKYIMTKLHERCFAASEYDRKMDAHLEARLKALSFLPAESLDIPHRLKSGATWSIAQQELGRMNDYKAPRDKLTCVLNCCRVLSQLCSTKEGAGADDFLPLLIYVTLKGRPARIWSNLEYIRRFRASNRLTGEASYYFTNAVSAAEFFRQLTPSQLSNVSWQEVVSAISQADHEAPAPPSPQRPVQSDDARKHPSVRSSDDGGVSHALGAFLGYGRVSGAGSALIALPEGVRTADDVEGFGYNRMAENGTQRSDLVQKFRFIGTNADSLLVSHVESLLSDYKELALRCGPSAKRAFFLAILLKRNSPS